MAEMPSTDLLPHLKPRSEVLGVAEALVERSLSLSFLTVLLLRNRPVLRPRSLPLPSEKRRHDRLRRRRRRQRPSELPPWSPPRRPRGRRRHSCGQRTLKGAGGEGVGRSVLPRVGASGAGARRRGLRGAGLVAGGEMVGVVDHGD